MFIAADNWDIHKKDEKRMVCRGGNYYVHVENARHQRGPKNGRNSKLVSNELFGKSFWIAGFGRAKLPKKSPGGSC